MFTPERFAVSLAIAGLAFATCANPADLGRELPHTQLGRPLDAEPGVLTVWPDGRGLPSGAGSVASGAQLYAERCQACHGERGTGGSGGVSYLAKAIELKFFPELWQIRTSM